METKTVTRNVKLGIFVTGGLIFLVIMLYMIGSSRNLFSPTFSIKAHFHNVNGLMVGNNVRFAGIDVGTVKKIEIVSDTSVNVIMIIEKSVRNYIKKNAIASIGTDGLMGSKLVNINSSLLPSDPIQTGDTLNSQRPIEGDEMLRTLNTTNENLAIITGDMRKITSKINNSKSLWSMLSDTIIAVDLKSAVSDIRIASNRTVMLINHADGVIRQIENGNGLAGYLLTDTTFANKFNFAIQGIQQSGENLSHVTEELTHIMRNIQQGEGTLGLVVSDTLFKQNLEVSLDKLKSGLDGFDQNMEALKHNFLFRGYFKKQNKNQ